jgi:hypothetical protein
MWYRPAESFDTVTVDGTEPSGTGRDQRIFNGSAIFASFTWLSRYLNPNVVYVAEAFDLCRDLNFGYLVRLPQKFTYAVCSCRTACCNGTDATFPNHCVSGS